MLFESLIIEVWRKSCEFQKYTIGNIYRLPLYTSDDLTIFIDEYTQLLHELRLRSKTVYLCGDYNIDLLKIDSNESSALFMKTLLQSDLCLRLRFVQEFAKPRVLLLTIYVQM